jgi:apolipoprotein N-acyltransferase
MKLASSFVLGILLGVLIAKSSLIDAAISELSKVRMPSIEVPESPLTEGLRFLLKLPSLDIIAFAMGLLIFIAIAWWIGGSSNARKIIITVALLIVWAILSFIVTASGGLSL